MNVLLSRRFVLALGVLCFLDISTQARAGDKIDFARHPFFKLLIGEWKSEGTLKGPVGKEVKIEETWTGKATAEGDFVMEGHRMIDQDKQTYEWRFTHDAATGSFTATHHVTSNGEESKRFEVSVSEVALTMELRLIGEGDSAITVKDAFSGKDHDTLESEVTLTGTAGETNLSGKIIHTRMKKP